MKIAHQSNNLIISNTLYSLTLREYLLKVLYNSQERKTMGIRCRDDFQIGGEEIRKVS